MTSIYIYIILILLLIIVLLVWMASGTRHIVRGICEIKDMRNKKKEDRKKKILSLIKKKGKADNENLRKLLNISGKTVVNYCDELEKEGKIKQVGKTGCSVYYKLK